MAAAKYAPFLALIEDEPDDTLLRFGLGRLYFDDGLPADAAVHYARAVAVDPDYSAAWRELGRAHEAAGDVAAARTAWESGLVAADKKGDLQTEKELKVFLKRTAQPPRCCPCSRR